MRRAVSFAGATDMLEGPPPSDGPSDDSRSVLPRPESSLTLLKRAQAGDTDALNELCTRYLPRLQRWAHGRLPERTRHGLDTHDLAQDTLIQVVKRLHTFEPRHEGALQAYVRQALLNRIRDEIRRSDRHPQEPLESGSPTGDPSPLEEAIGRETLERYEMALQRLKPGDREAIIARIELGSSYPELAAALGKPTVAAAHMTVSRALHRLAKEMARAPSG